MVLLVHMADRRRLQGEIDKTLKKVNEGVDAFDDVWQKLVIVSRLPVQTATNINQKEKYESELKKEIKKLQRLREQIKTWQSSNEIKDKKPLLEARKNIEQQMERFKVIERETKQKPYSKDALGGAYKFDPLHKEQEDLREWLQSCNNKLNSKVDELETRLEDLNANKKKRMDKEKIEITKTSLETHRHYMETLERIGTMLQKQQLSVKKVQEIKYDIDDFIENSDQPEYSINPDLFEELELDKYDSASALCETPAGLSDMQSFQSFYIYVINLLTQYLSDIADEDCLVILYKTLYERTDDLLSENVLKKLRILFSKSRHFF